MGAMVRKPIRVLADDVINKIAAGEVVDRPASVVKELVENALDAGASAIDVEIVAGGKTLIAVSDNGFGMDRNNALLAIERHATSKIGGVGDIEKIATMGFRGEALAAISAVSRFRMRTRPAEELSGTELVMAGGKLQDVRASGCPPGTLVEVRNLFFNVPARRKFLRSERTEEAYAREAFIAHALANPETGFRLKCDGRTVSALPCNATVGQRLGDLFPSIALADLRPVSGCSGAVRVTGFVGLPSATRADRSGQRFFVNRRPVAATLLSGAVRDGYDTLVPKNRHPVVFLFLELAPELVDVNVHPAKREVRFFSPAAVREAVSSAIRQALRAPGNVFGGVDRALPLAAVSPSRPPGTARGRGAGEIEHPVRISLPGPGRKSFARSRESMLPLAGQAPGAVRAPWSWRRFIGQIGNLYAILETEDGLVLMDFHAAHERVLFEEFMALSASGDVRSQALLMAETVVLPPADADCLRRNLSALQKAGFGVSHFGRDTFLVDAVPACFGSAPARGLILEIAGALNEASDRAKGIAAVEEIVARSACRAAVKARTRIEPQEMERLIERLERAEMPYTCPHGRPIIIHFSFQELAKRFGRTPPSGESAGNG